MYLKGNLKRGFTLIELLVVISIIGTLSTVVLTSLNGARAKARDARRNSDMNEIRNALELYYADHGSYPSTSGVQVCLGLPSTEECWNGQYSGTYKALKGNANVNTQLAPYLPQIPKDPLYGKGGRTYSAYVYSSPGSYYLPPSSSFTGAYSIAFMPDVVSGSPNCGGWIFGAWDSSAHCNGGSCRQCGYLKES